MGSIPRDGAGRPKKKSPDDQHAGEAETSAMLANRPDLVHMDRAKSQSGADQHRVTLPAGIYTGIWWYASFPNHYAGDGSTATKELGEFDQKNWSHDIAAAVKAIKADQESARLQKEFFEEAQHPLDTHQ
jgi:creatinine amidohydrolase